MAFQLISTVIDEVKLNKILSVQITVYRFIWILINKSRKQSFRVYRTSTKTAHTETKYWKASMRYDFTQNSNWALIKGRKSFNTESR